MVFVALVVCPGLFFIRLLPCLWQVRDFTPTRKLHADQQTTPCRRPGRALVCGMSLHSFLVRFATVGGQRFSRLLKPDFGRPSVQTRPTNYDPQHTRGPIYSQRRGPRSCEVWRGICSRACHFFAPQLCAGMIKICRAGFDGRSVRALRILLKSCPPTVAVKNN